MAAPSFSTWMVGNSYPWDYFRLDRDRSASSLRDTMPGTPGITCGSKYRQLHAVVSRRLSHEILVDHFTSNKN